MTGCPSRIRGTFGARFYFTRRRSIELVFSGSSRNATRSIVSTWAAELESTPELREHAALLHYYLALELNKLGNDEALRSLVVRYEELGRPFDMSVALLQELNPTDPSQAEKIVEVAGRVREK